MPKISFHGLCGFAKRGKEVHVLMPDAHDHRAFMMIDLADVEAHEGWNPDDVLPSPDDKQLAVWELAGLKLSAGEGEDDPSLPKDMISLVGLHELKEPAVLKSGAQMSLTGGDIKENKKYPVGLKIVNSLTSKTKVEASNYTEVVEWRTGSLVIRAGDFAIKLKRGDVAVSITNAMPGFSPGHGGLAHFGGYYSTVKVPAADQLKLEVVSLAFSAGAGNCTPNAVLP